MQPDHKFITLRFSLLTVSAFVVLVVAAVAATTYSITKDLQLAQLYAAILLGGAGATSAIYAVETFRLNYRREQQKAAFQFLAAYAELDVFAIKHFLDTSVQDCSSWEELFSNCMKDPSQRRLLDQTRNMLGLFDDIAIAIRSGYADELVLYQSLGEAIPRHYHSCEKKFLNFKMSQFVEKSKTADEPTLCTFYEVADDLVHAWERHQSVIDGRKLPGNNEKPGT